MAPRFRAVSLDLWFTTVWFAPPALDRWREARESALREILSFPGGKFPSSERLQEARGAVRRKFDPARSSHFMDVSDTLSPARYLTLLAGELQGRLTCSAEEAGLRYSNAGLKESPPVINPEAVELVRALERERIPTVATTNTGRLSVSWQRFFEDRGGPRFRAVVTSCEVGKGKPSREIFEAASRTLGIPPEEILHVGDRWDIDVTGARQAGMGRSLYRGLWPKYFDPEDRASTLRLDDGGPDVLRIDRMDQLLGPEVGLVSRG